MIGTTLGPYRIDRELGSGGMGKVYAATTARKAAGLEPDTIVALKVVHAHLTDTEGVFKRFLREGEIGKSVRHENVVRTYDCDALTGQMYLVMEYVEGQTLRDLLSELERVPEELCRHIGREIAKGLAAIHAAGVIHRDMKPENVLITGEHVVNVMDLGVARLNDEALRLSQTGAFVGSIHYAAPECFSEGGENVDGRADLHSLGLVLHELACGANPYYAESIPEVLKKVLHEEPRRLGEALRLTEESLAVRRKIRHGDGIAESLITLGDLRRRAGDADAARVALEEALTLSREQGQQGRVGHALALLARLPGGDAEAARAAVAEVGEDADSLALRFQLWKATGDLADLKEARRLLDEKLAKMPAEYRESLRSNDPDNREILAACKEQGL